MPQQTIEAMPANTPEMPEILQSVLLQALEVAQEKMNAGELLVPFTALAVGETLFMESHPADDPDDCFKMARHTVQNARGALAYAFCYDGYVETDDGEKDAIIAEGGLPGESGGHAVGFLYTVEGEGEAETYTFEEHAVYIGEAPNFMEFTLIVSDDVEDDDEDAKSIDGAGEHDGVDGNDYEGEYAGMDEAGDGEDVNEDECEDEDKG